MKLIYCRRIPSQLVKDLEMRAENDLKFRVAGGVRGEDTPFVVEDVMRKKERKRRRVERNPEDRSRISKMAR